MSKRSVNNILPESGNSLHAVDLLAPRLSKSNSYICELDHVYPAEVTNDCDLTFVRSGEGSLTVGKESLPLRPGDVILLRPGTSLQLASGRGERLSFIYAHFDPRPDQTGDLGLEIPQRTPGPAPARIAECFEQLAASRFLKNETVRSVRSRALLLEILLYLYERTLPAPADEGMSLWDCDRIHRAVDRMRRGLAEPLTLKEIARTAGLSPAYFTKLFHRAVGEPPKAHLLRLRVEAARDLLRDTTLPVKQIAARTGFTSIQYFSRIFHRQMGISPRQFRGRKASSGRGS